MSETTKSAALALADERALMRQGYTFLDEKRMLVAAELLRRLKVHAADEIALADDLQHAADALRAALGRHGLEGLATYPPRQPRPRAPATSRALFLGVPLVEAAAEPVPMAYDDALDASPEAAACAEAFRALLPALSRLAASAGNATRLAAEYRRTERRARALENVLLPEVGRALAAIDEQLSLADQEEAVRIRHAAAQREAGSQDRLLRHEARRGSGRLTITRPRAATGGRVRRDSGR